jgi:hypothetical protein
VAKLRNPKRELFARELYFARAEGLSGRKAEEKAAKAAGYKGSALAKNAHKLAQHPDIKKRLAELAAPADEKQQKQIEATKEWARQRLAGIADVPLEPDDIRAADQIAALRLLAEIDGWKAPVRNEMTGPDGEPLPAAVVVEVVRFSNAPSPAPPQLATAPASA